MVKPSLFQGLLTVLGLGQFLIVSPQLVSLTTGLHLYLVSLLWNKLSPSSEMGFPGGAIGKEFTCQCRRHKRHGFDPWVRKEGTATHSRILAWKIPWTEEAGRLQSTESQTVRHE